MTEDEMVGWQLTFAGRGREVPVAPSHPALPRPASPTSCCTFSKGDPPPFIQQVLKPDLARQPKPNPAVP